jgi:hypothetical protein
MTMKLCLMLWMFVCVTGCAVGHVDPVKVMPMPASDAGSETLSCEAMYGPGCSQIVGENGYPACECVSELPPASENVALFAASTCFVDMGGGLGTGYDLHCGVKTSAFAISWANGSCDATHSDVCNVGTACTITGLGVNLTGVCQ